MARRLTREEKRQRREERRARWRALWYGEPTEEEVAAEATFAGDLTLASVRLRSTSHDGTSYIVVNVAIVSEDFEALGEDGILALVERLPDDQPYAVPETAADQRLLEAMKESDGLYAFGIKSRTDRAWDITDELTPLAVVPYNAVLDDELPTITWYDVTEDHRDRPRSKRGWYVSRKLEAASPIGLSPSERTYLERQPGWRPATEESD